MSGDLTKYVEGYLHHKNVTVNHHQVYNTICQAGLNNPVTKPRKTWGTTRFEREHNNWFMASGFQTL